MEIELIDEIREKFVSFILDSKKKEKDACSKLKEKEGNINEEEIDLYIFSEVPDSRSLIEEIIKESKISKVSKVSKVKGITFKEYYYIYKMAMEQAGRHRAEIRSREDLMDPIAYLIGTEKIDKLPQKSIEEIFKERGCLHERSKGTTYLLMLVRNNYLKLIIEKCKNKTAMVLKDFLEGGEAIEVYRIDQLHKIPWENFTDKDCAENIENLKKFYKNSDNKEKILQELKKAINRGEGYLKVKQEEEIYV
jgi:hypothetical protein